MLYGFGSNGAGQLGLRDSTRDHSTPQLIAQLGEYTSSNIKHIAAGGNHTLFLLDNNKVIATGNNEDGRCMRSPNLSQGEVRKIWVHDMANAIVSGVVQVTATWSATTLLMQDGTIWTCGSGGNGELGLGEGIKEAQVLQQIPGFPPGATEVVHIASCMSHTIGTLSNGAVYGWGKGRKGQLGPPLADAWVPRKIGGIPFPVSKAACGRDFTCLIGARGAGDILVLGPDSNDRFGVNANAPGKVPDWKQGAASWGSIYILKDSGELLAWGRDDHGQLPPPDLPPVEVIAAGSEHCLAISKTGQVLAWGWGEHGNCGKPTDASGDVKGRCNEVELPHPPYAVFAGCATSFVAVSNKPNREIGVG